MAKPAKQAKPKPITFVLSDTQKARLKKIGLRRNSGKAIVLRARLKNGRLVVTHHQLPNGDFTPSNAAFA